MRRVDASNLLRSAVGETPPKTGDVIIWEGSGWKLERMNWRGSFSEDPDDAQDGDYWFNSADKTLRIKVGDDTYKSDVWVLV